MFISIANYVVPAPNDKNDRRINSKTHPLQVRNDRDGQNMTISK